MRKSTKKTTKKNDGERKTRACLMCRRLFESEWAGERVCRKCKSTAAWRNAV